jgi:positive regulator of sigma E activity
MDTMIVRQSQMTAECWLIQFQGKKACDECEARDTGDCGGENIRKTGKNEKGFSVPLGSKI